LLCKELNIHVSVNARAGQEKPDRSPTISSVLFSVFVKLSESFVFKFKMRFWNHFVFVSNQFFYDFR
jgi:hypothetical protein